MLRNGRTTDARSDHVEVVRNKLDGIANEMELTLLRSSFSPIVKEGLDASASLFTLQGETLAQAIAIPIHLGDADPVRRDACSTTFPLETMREGDIYCMNDPYLGGTHLPDIAVVMPVFARGRPIAFAATMTHHQDVGGMAPGSVPTNATEIFQEGIRIPPLQAARRRRIQRHAARRSCGSNVRIPDTFEGDLNAQVAACTVGARRCRAAGRRSTATTSSLAIFDELLDRSETMTRAGAARHPGGTYRARRLPRQRRHRARQAHPHRGRGDGRATARCTATSPAPRRRCAGLQLRAVGRAAPPPASPCAPSPIPTHPDQRRLLPADHAEPAGGLASSIRASRRRSTRARRRSSASPARILGAFAQAVPDRVPADSGGEMLVLAFRRAAPRRLALRHRRAGRGRQRRRRAHRTASTSSRPTPPTA